MVKRFSRFQRGTGCYKCAICKRLTRNTGAQGFDSELCPECWEIAGFDNAAMDGCGEPYRAEAEAMLKVIAQRGGNVEEVKKQNGAIFALPLGGG